MDVPVTEVLSWAAHSYLPPEFERVSTACLAYLAWRRLRYLKDRISALERANLSPMTTEFIASPNFWTGRSVYRDPSFIVVHATG